MILDELIKNNAYPIIFVGSGISKRYISSFPTWEQLLEKYWNVINPNQNFYGFLNEIRDNISEKGIENEKLNFYANIHAADRLEKEYKSLFFQGKIQNINLDMKDAYHTGMSPFKKAISEQLSNYELDSDYIEELEAWKSFIHKAQIIITTNYDTFIEDTYDKEYKGNIKTYIGQKGFFDHTEGWAELFKIHGSVTKPNSIVINSDDYKRYNKHSILISAKIISSMVNSPIIFLGYRLQDINVRKIISDFASQLPFEDTRKSARRIIIVEWVREKTDIDEELITDTALGCHYTLIKTDNYKYIYDKVSQINQGLTPYEVRRYQDTIKRLVISSGKKGNLDAVLLSPQDLDKVNTDLIEGKPIVVALGDKRLIYVMPTLDNYLRDYIFHEDNFVPEVALRFIAKENTNARTPFVRHYKNCDFDKLSIQPEEKEKIRRKIKDHGSLQKVIGSVNNSYQIHFDSLKSILSQNEYPDNKKLDVITFNIQSLNKNELDDYIKKDIFPSFIKSKDSSLRTSMRRLMMAFDLLINGDIEK